MDHKVLYLHVKTGDTLFVNVVIEVKDIQQTVVIYTNCTKPLKEGETPEDRVSCMTLDKFQGLIDAGSLIPQERKGV